MGKVKKENFAINGPNNSKTKFERTISKAIFLQSQETYIIQFIQGICLLMTMNCSIDCTTVVKYFTSKALPLIWVDEMLVQTLSPRLHVFKPNISHKGLTQDVHIWTVVLTVPQISAWECCPVTL